MEAARPTSRAEFLSAAQSLASQGRFEEIIEAAGARIGWEPDFAEVRFVLAYSFVQIGRFEEAVGQLEELLRQQPERKEAMFALATALVGAGRPEAALDHFEKFLKMEPKAPVALYEACKLALQLGRPELGRTYAARLTRIRPDFAEWWFLLGSANAILDRLESAINALETALKLDPAHIDSRNVLFRSYVQLDRHLEAAELMRAGLKVSPNHPEFLYSLASSLAYLGQDDEAEALYLRAIDEDSEVIGSYASFLQERGRFTEAGAALEKAIETTPQLGIAYYQLAELKSFTVAGKPLTELASQALQSDDLRPEQRMYLNYALSRSLEADHKYEQAMSRLDDANAAAFQIHNLGRTYDPKQEREILERRVERFSKSVLAKPIGSPSKRPIFIVGMIRSGTTLLDQILSSHPDVKSAGELKFWGVEADRWSQNREELSSEVAKRLSTDYLQRLSEFGGQSRVTDKMPLNYHHLGLIHTCFPSAKIVHIKRDPLDTCLSIYSTYVGRGPKWAYDQTNIVENYRQYEWLMEHWRSALPSSSFFEVDYESLVGSTEANVREILEFCDLPWSESCLHPEQNSDQIKTPSRWQARQPIYKSSVSRAANFRPYLGALRELSGSKSGSHSGNLAERLIDEE